MADYASANLRRVMSRLGLTIDHVVARTGLDRRTIRAILNGAHRTHARTLHRLAAGLGVSPDEFFVDPASLVYRCFDQVTNPVVAEVVQRHPELFAGWMEADFEELHSRFGAGGPLTEEGAVAAATAMNRNRATHEQLAVLLESSQAELIRAIVAAMYEQLVASGNHESPKESQPGLRP